jgi:hypothetical protein
MAGIMLRIVDLYSEAMPPPGYWLFMTWTQGSMGRRASSWFLRSLESRLRLKPVKWQVICGLLVDIPIKAFKGGLVVATHH